MKTLRAPSSGLFAVFMLMTGSPLLAVPGDLDPTFGGNGRVMTSLSGGDSSGTGLAIQNDGKILLAGYSRINNDADFTVLRYKTDGTLDAGFNGIGYVRTNINGDSDNGSSVAIQEDGKIIVAGKVIAPGASFDFALIRYNSDGSLDLSFNTTGKVVTDFGGNDHANSVTVQADGKIVIAGETDNDFAVARYNPDGSLDPGFGTGGKVRTDFGRSDRGIDVALQADGKIVVAGSSNDSVGTFMALARYSMDGSLDMTFNAIGKLAIDPSGRGGAAQGVALQTDGRIVIAGSTADLSGDFAIVRTNSDGSLDGVATTDFGGDDSATSVVVQADGKIVAAGITVRNGNRDFALARYNPDGSPDTAFHGGGVTSDFTLYDYCYGVAIQSDGQIVVGGNTFGSFTVARYLAEPAPAISVEYQGVPISGSGSGKVNFGTVNAAGSASVSLTIRNAGDAPLTDLAVTKSATGSPGDFLVGPLGAVSLPPGATTAFTVTFSPTAPGLRTATLLIASNDADRNPVTINLEGTQPFQDISIEQPAGTVLIDGSGPPVDFGRVAVGGSVELTFTVRNPGGSPLTGLAVNKAVSGTPAQFSVGPLGATSLPPLSSTTFTVTFSPSTTDPATATLQITSNDEDENPFEITLSGNWGLTLEAWRQANFGSPSNTGAGADLNDPDADGMLNVLEFALATDPNSKTAAPGTLVKNGNRLEFTFERSKAALAEIDYRLEWSESISGAWTAVGPTIVIISDDGLMQQVTFGVPAGSLGRRFTRLRVTKL